MDALLPQNEVIQSGGSKAPEMYCTLFGHELLSPGDCPYARVGHRYCSPTMIWGIFCEIECLS